MVASVHSVLVEAGQDIEVGDTLMILESMKMEIPVLCESAGTVSEISVAPGDVVREGDVLAIIL
jgi:biotin carboxyl carrier protein